MVIKLKKTKHKKSFKITCTLLLLICITIGLFHFLNKDHTSNKSVSKSLNKETKKIVNASFIEIGEHVISMGIDAVNLANNHANDAGIEGRNNTINFFKQHNILTTGVYESKDARQHIPTKSINDITFSFLGYTYKTNKLDYQNQDLIGYYRNLDTMELDNNHKEIIKNEVTQAKLVSDIVIYLCN